MTAPSELQDLAKPESPRQDLLRRAVVELRAAKAEVAALTARTREPVAVIGIGCRFPGGVTDPESFWQLLTSGTDAITTTPPDRWDGDTLYHPDPDAPGHTYTRHGGYLSNIRDFDAGLFGIPPREAAGIDPQQRLVLETAWHAIEHAGIAPDSLSGTNTGVFIGAAASDYERLTRATHSTHDINPYTASGNATNFTANRLSYTLGLTGPSISLDTACSSSLVAVHLALQSLRTGECDLAIVGGVNLLLAPDTTIALSKSRMLSTQGHCATFDATADGYVRGEGCGIIVLRRMSTPSAQPPIAVILGSAVNQDGKTSGLTVPHGNAQQRVISAALANAGVSPSQIGYLEAHGTGTPLGDPIETHAITTTLTPHRTTPLHLGSVKTNIGHLETAAGIAGLIKTILTLHHGSIPPHLHYTTPNPHLTLNHHTTIPTTNTPWTQTTRTAGTSSFGFGGTNAHIITQNYSSTAALPDRIHQDAPTLIKLAANTPIALQQIVSRLHHHLSTRPTPDLAAVAWTTNTARADLPHRHAVVAASTAELVAALARFSENPAGSTPPRNRPALTWLIPGESADLAGSLRQLGGNPAVIRLIQSFGGPDTPTAQFLLSGSDAESAPELTVRAAGYLRALALAGYWKSLGITPDSISGCGAGAYAAAVLAGILSAEDGLELVHLRARIEAGLAGSEQVDRLIGRITFRPPATPVILELPTHSGGELLTPARQWAAQLLGSRPEPVPVADPEASLELGFGGTDPARFLADSTARLWLLGFEIRWTAVGSAPAEPVRLPGYPFQAVTHWTEPPVGPGRAELEPLAPEVIDLADGRLIGQTRLSLSSLPFLDEHRVHGHLVVPGVVFLELALRTAEHWTPGISLQRLALSRPLVLAESDEAELQVLIEPADDGTAAVHVHSRPAGADPGPWRAHLEATAGPVGERPDPVPMNDENAWYSEIFDQSGFYARAWHQQFALGPSFRLVHEARLGSGAAHGILTLPDPQSLGARAGVRPDLLLLDACVQLVRVAAGRADAAIGPVHLGTGYERLEILRTPAPGRAISCTATIRAGGEHDVLGDLVLRDDDGVLVRMSGVSFRAVSDELLRRVLAPRTPARPAAGPARLDLVALRELDPASRLNSVQNHVNALFSGILGLTGDERVDPDATIAELADSLMLAELHGLIGDHFGIALQLETLLEAGTLTGLADAVCGQLAIETARTRHHLTVAQMSALAELDESFQVRKPAATDAPDAVLLTGGSGFVGAFLLAELLRRPGPVYCLVRAENEEHARRRLVENLASYDLEPDLSNLRPLAGDLSEPFLGLGEARFTALHGEIGMIFHNGATVKWTYPYSSLAAANVAGTREVLRLALLGAARPVHFTSTVGVFSSTEDRRDRVREDDDLLTSGALAVGYAQSKWVAERMVRTAHERGLPVTIHRINTGGHSRTGAFNRLDHLSMMIKGCIESRTAPVHANMPIQPAPVEYVAAAITALAFDPEFTGRTSHLVNPEVLSWTELFDQVEAFGFPIERLPFADWKDRVTGRKAGTMALLGLVPFLNDTVDHVRLAVSDCERTRAALAGSGIDCPALDATLIHTYLERFISSGFIRTKPTASTSRRDAETAHD